MTDILEQLKSGKCLCLQCKRIAPAGYNVTEGRGRDTFVGCYYGCEYENGSSVGVITWDSIQYGEPTPDGVSEKDVAWLDANYPEIMQEIDRVENMPIGRAFEHELMAAE